MIRAIIILTVVLIATMSITCNADMSTLGLTPEQYLELERSNQANRAIMLQMLMEKQRIEQERAQNPYIDCILISNIEGVNMDEAKNIAVRLGANSIKWINVSSTKVTAQAYNCP